MSLFLFACGAPEAELPAASSPEWATPPGDPELGYAALLNEDYVKCGVPASVWEQYFGASPRSQRIRSREGANAELAYYLTAATTDDGVELITTNCLYCHATVFNGDIQIGLGNPWLDFTTDTATYAALVPALTDDPAERAEAEKWAERVGATGASIVTDTIGINPADTLAQALFAHRDPTTLAWSSDAQLDVPGGPIPTDVPPLWNMKKKTASLYTGGGQGNLARIMMTASALCTDDIDEAESIYSYFPDIYAYVASIEPPAWPGEIDATLAAEGEVVFEESCADCHGTYGDDWTYDTRVIPLETIGTDPVLAESFAGDAAPYAEWFNSSWYGQDARLALSDGYVAPPLDGVWATAPYLHNGSVPTLAALLDSGTRPDAFVRSPAYDLVDVGWEWTEAPDGKDTAGHDEIDVYDTRLPGFSAGGHLFGDALTADERAALLEWLKTL